MKPVGTQSERGYLASIRKICQWEIVSNKCAIPEPGDCQIAQRRPSQRALLGYTKGLRISQTNADTSKLEHLNVTLPFTRWMMVCVYGRVRWTLLARASACTEVFQGSVLQHLVFLIFISDMAAKIKCLPYLFTDDEKIAGTCGFHPKHNLLLCSFTMISTILMHFLGRAVCTIVIYNAINGVSMLILLLCKTCESG